MKNIINYTYEVVLIWYLCAVNVITFLLYGLDKQKAIRRKWRIPESVLLTAAAIGGSAGAFFGMRLFRHKTKKAKFYIGIPVLLVLQAVAIAVIM